MNFFARNFNAVAILAVGLLCCARMSSAASQVIVWGANFSGQTNVPSSLSNAVAIASGDWHQMALKSDGTVVCWANPTWLNPPADLSNVVNIVSSPSGYQGDDRILALKTDGTVITWGYASPQSRAFLATVSNMVGVASSLYKALGVKSDGTVVGWDSYGQTATPTNLFNVVAVAVGDSYGLALTADGKMSAWGYGPQTNIPTGLSNIVSIAASEHVSLALKSDGQVVGWGDTIIPNQLSNVVAIAAGYYHGIALKKDGIVVAWGNNYYGQTSVPVGLSNVVTIAASVNNSMALAGDALPVVQVLATNVTVNTNGFSLSIPTQSGRVYRLEYVSPLGATNWTALPLVAGNGGTRKLTDATATNSAARFYRVRRW